MSTITQDLYDSHKTRGMYVDTMYAPYRSWRAFYARRAFCACARLSRAAIYVTSQNNDSISANIRKWPERRPHSESKRSAISSDHNRRCALCAIVRLKSHENIIQSEPMGRCADRQEPTDFECMDDPRGAFVFSTWDRPGTCRRYHNN